jgi:hypothetical protein
MAIFGEGIVIYIRFCSRFVSFHQNTAEPEEGVGGTAPAQLRCYPASKQAGQHLGVEFIEQPLSRLRLVTSDS